MTQTAVEKNKFTYADYLKTPDDKRYELIEGDLIMTPSPVTAHQRISGKIEFELRKHVLAHDLGEVFDAPLDVYLDDENVFQPDIMFISKDRARIIGEKNIQGAPDLVIEILSESTAYKDMVQKKKLYAKFGVKEYWIVTPEEASITIYLPQNAVFQPAYTYSGDEVLESPSLPGLGMPVKVVFS
jgi:Uma2 family endonuclease